MDSQILTEPHGGLLFGRAHVRHLRICEGHSRNYAGHTGAAAGKQNIAYSVKRLPPGIVRELLSAHDIARGINPAGRCAQSCIDLNTSNGVLHAGLFEIQTDYVRYASGGDKEHLPARLVGIRGYHNRIAVGAYRDGALREQSDTLTLEHVP